MADNLYQFTGKVKLDQVFPRLFSRDFIFCFCQKNLPSFGLAKKKVFGLTLLSRKSLEKGRFLLIIIFARQGCTTSPIKLCGVPDRDFRASATGRNQRYRALIAVRLIKSILCPSAVFAVRRIAAVLVCALVLILCIRIGRVRAIL